MRRDLLVLALLVLAAGCGERQRLNPFDPGNPVTGGRPPGFEALADDGLVRLRWNPTPSPDLRGYELFRRIAGETTYVAISGLIPPSTTAFGDFGLRNGVDHFYRLYYVFDPGIGGLPAEDVATPGPLQPWVADFDRPAAVRLTADGRHIFGEDDSPLGPTDVAADAGLGVVWISDTGGQRVIVLTPSNGNHVTISGSVQSPGAIALDPLDGTAWVCDESQGAVVHFNSNGTVAAPFLLGPFADPLDIATDPADRSLWVCERTGDRVAHVSSSGATLGRIALGAPSRVAVDSATHAAWCTSFTSGRVYVISNVPALRDSFGGFQGPVGIAVDGRRGRIWVADGLANQVVALKRDGSEEFRVGGLAEAREIAIDLASGNAWVTFPGAGGVALISPAGELIRRTGGMKRPLGISLGGVR
ncbi:MAG: hypothetical protein HYR73_00770 [Candidatus Eisenbacteria bacterium]|nr:hypothetical protein [Candidatus Eisenbacteria bacterium]